MILICLITSKGAAGVVGSAFIVLAATLASLKTIPVEGMVLILGVDRLMAEARAITNLIGNGVATILVSKWEGEFDAARAEAMLRAGPPSLGGNRSRPPAAKSRGRCRRGIAGPEQDSEASNNLVSDPQVMKRSREATNRRTLPVGKRQLAQVGLSTTLRLAGIGRAGITPSSKSRQS